MYAPQGILKICKRSRILALFFLRHTLFGIGHLLASALSFLLGGSAALGRIRVMLPSDLRHHRPLSRRLLRIRLLSSVAPQAL